MSSAAAETTGGGSESREAGRDFNPRYIPRRNTAPRVQDDGHWSDDGFCVPTEDHLVQLIGYQRRTTIEEASSLFMKAEVLAKQRLYRDYSGARH